MKYMVKIDNEQFSVDAPNVYEAKVKASREFSKKYPSHFPTGMEVMAKTKIVVIPLDQK
jgi:hypothetical protein